jgi:hypothetical protein
MDGYGLPVPPCIISQADCFPHIYLDSRYAIRGTSLAAAPTLRDGTCTNLDEIASSSAFTAG